MGIKLLDVRKVDGMLHLRRWRTKKNWVLRKKIFFF